jgi:hypothetical protein
MRKITLICSAHRQNGLCNSEELLKILRELEPEVAFGEWRPSEFDVYYQRGTLEAHAITKYREFKPFQAVPVDRFDMSDRQLAKFKRELDFVLDYVAHASQEYQILEEENDHNVRQHGFRYLNSADFARRRARMSEIESGVIGGANNQELLGVLATWRDFTDRREVGMVNNIYEYCRQNSFVTGVFLLGAAHKTDIVKKIGRHNGKEPDLIEWSFDYDIGS